MQKSSTSKQVVILALALTACLANGCGKTQPAPTVTAGDAAEPQAGPAATATAAPPAELPLTATPAALPGTGSATAAGGGAALFAPPVPPAVDAALGQLQRSLATRLQTALASEGPVGAMAACHADAPSLTLAAQVPGIALGRTSHRLRNPASAPPAWAAATVAAAASLPVTAVRAQTFALPGGKVGLLRPILTAPVCVTCHGPKEAMPAPLQQALASRYPQDQATDFAAGSLRGWFWAEWSATP